MQGPLARPPRSNKSSPEFQIKLECVTAVIRHNAIPDERGKRANSKEVRTWQILDREHSLASDPRRHLGGYSLQLNSSRLFEVVVHPKAKARGWTLLMTDAVLTCAVRLVGKSRGQLGKVYYKSAWRRRT